MENRLIGLLVGIGFVATGWVYAAPLELSEEGGSIRAASLGLAFTAVGEEIDAIWGNPAGLGRMTSYQTQINHANLFGESTETSAGFGFPDVGFGNIAIGYHLSRAPDIIQTDVSGNALSTVTFQTRNMLLGTSYRISRNLVFGFKGKWIQKNFLDSTQSGASADIGALLTHGNMTFGVHLQDILSKAIGSDEIDPIYRAGVAVRPAGHLVLVSADVVKTESRSLAGHLGVEFTPLYNYAFRIGMENLSHLHLGTKIYLLPFMLELGYENQSDLGAIYRLGVRMDF